MTTSYPPAIAEIIDDFQAVTDQEKLELLLEFSRELPELPASYSQAQRDAMEQVVECQSPLFLSVEFDDEHERVHLLFSAPAEAPTTRGFASILYAGLDGLPYQEILDVPADMPQKLGLSHVITPLRLRGMTAMLTRIKNQIRKHYDA